MGWEPGVGGCSIGVLLKEARRCRNPSFAVGVSDAASAAHELWKSSSRRARTCGTGSGRGLATHPGKPVTRAPIIGSGQPAVSDVQVLPAADQTQISAIAGAAF